jgi:hypothetical protein
MGLALSELGGGAKAWSPENIGDKISGKIRLIERRQARSLDTKQLETWDDGTPKMLTYIEIETDLHENDDDDGKPFAVRQGGRNHEASTGTGTSMEVAIARP